MQSRRRSAAAESRRRGGGGGGGGGEGGDDQQAAQGGGGGGGPSGDPSGGAGAGSGTNKLRKLGFSEEGPGRWALGSISGVFGRRYLLRPNCALEFFFATHEAPLLVVFKDAARRQK